MFDLCARVNVIKCFPMYPYLPEITKQEVDENSYHSNNLELIMWRNLEVEPLCKIF